ncbi:MAG: hypothetical protein ACSHX0_12065 [Akkermansiaceae bacterium]
MFALLALETSAFAWTNQLQNSGFEANPPSGALGNHLNHSIAPWQCSSGASDYPNVVKVNGVANSTGGPIFDASGSTQGAIRHYLDIVGSNSFSQTFIAQGSGLASYGGFFSTRDNREGIARVSIRNAAGQSVTSQPGNLPSGNSATDSWVLVSASTQLTAGDTYTLIIYMDNFMNFDNGFVSFEGLPPNPGDPVLADAGSLSANTGPVSVVNDSVVNDPIYVNTDSLYVDTDVLNIMAPELNPCCPPINKEVIMQQLTPVFQPNGGSNSKYRLNFSATSTFSNQMLQYVDYVNSMNPQINAIVTNWRIFEKNDAGGPGSPVPTSNGLGTVVEEFFTTFSTVSPHLNLGNTSPSYPMKPNTWYRVITDTYFNNDLNFFDSEKCAVSEYWVNWMVASNKSSNGSNGKFVVRDGKRTIREFDVKNNSSETKTPPKTKPNSKGDAIKRLQKLKSR